MFTIPHYPEYLINELGQVYSTKSGNWLVQHTQSSGYLYYSLYYENKNKNVLLHRLLQHVFLGLKDLYDDEIEVDHRDENKINNQLSNLQLLSKEDHKVKSILYRGHNLRGSQASTCQCGSPKEPRALSCRQCYLSKVITDATQEEIETSVRNLGWVKAQKLFNLSDNGLRKRYKALSGKDPKTLRKCKQNVQN